MELVYLDYQHLSKIRENLVATIGQFDGLHQAHMFLIYQTIELAKDKKLKSAVITFDPHPDYVVKKDLSPTYITPIQEKIEYLKKTSLDYMIIINFDNHIMNMSPVDFIENILIANSVKETVVGYDFSFGKDGIGKAEDISSLSNGKIVNHIIEEKSYQGKKIGTSLVKWLLAEGKMEEVKFLLGRYYQIEGEVVKGKQIGRTIHVPTANLKVKPYFAIIKKGVYIVKVKIGDNEYLGIANLGNNPSFNYQENMVFETHIIDFSGDLYGKTLKIELVKYLRPEIKFDSKEKFMEQIKQDIYIAKNYQFD